jgi:saccharopine dehydrogenase-like NADP-dependent oxidoreductase
VPRHVLHALWDPQIRAAPDTRDLIIIRILAQGRKDARKAEALVELIHRYDEATGFTAMEQATGWHAAILAEAIAQRRVPKGVIPVEQAMSGAAFVDEAGRRGFDVRREVRSL